MQSIPILSSSKKKTLKNDCNKDWLLSQSKTFKKFKRYQNKRNSRSYQLSEEHAFALLSFAAILTYKEGKSRLRRFWNVTSIDKKLPGSIGKWESCPENCAGFLPPRKLTTWHRPRRGRGGRARKTWAVHQT